MTHTVLEVFVAGGDEDLPRSPRSSAAAAPCRSA